MSNAALFEFDMAPENAQSLFERLCTAWADEKKVHNVTLVNTRDRKLEFSTQQPNPEAEKAFSMIKTGSEKAISELLGGMADRLGIQDSALPTAGGETIQKQKDWECELNYYWSEEDFPAFCAAVDIILAVARGDVIYFRTPDANEYDDPITITTEQLPTYTPSMSDFQAYILRPAS